MRRCECSVRSPSKRMNRCLPWASTDRTPAPVQLLGPALAAGARVRGLDGADLPAGQRSADALGRVVDRVPLGHASDRTGGAARGSRLLWAPGGAGSTGKAACAAQQCSQQRSPRSSLRPPRWPNPGSSRARSGRRLNECAGATAGVRASQPGDAQGRAMFTRFSYQWQNAAGAWLPVPGAGSPWLAAGPGPWLNHESGWTQTFASGAGTRVRGVVDAVALGLRSGRGRPHPGHAGFLPAALMGVRGAGLADADAVLAVWEAAAARAPTARRAGGVRRAAERSPDGVRSPRTTAASWDCDRRLGWLARGDRPPGVLPSHRRGASATRSWTPPRRRCGRRGSAA